MIARLRYRKMVALLLSLLIVGCTDMSDLNRRTLVTAIGLDTGATPNEVEVTIQYGVRLGRRAGDGGGQTGKQSEAAEVMSRSVSAHSVGAGVNAIRAQVPGELFMGSIRLLVIGKELAMRGLKHELDYLMGEPYIATNLVTVVAHDRSATLLQHPWRNSPLEFLTSTLGIGGQKAASLLNLPLWQFYDSTMSPFRTVLVPVIALRQAGGEVIGHGILARGKLVEVAPIDQSTLLTTIDNARSVFLEIPGIPPSRSPISLHFRTLRTQGQLSPSGHEATIHIDGYAYVEEDDVAFTSAETYQALRDHTERQIARRMHQELRYLYGKGIDVLNLAEQMRRHSYDDRLPANWSERLTHISFRIYPRIRLLHGLRGN